ncbi:hypothetical protein [Streptosporangium lutulentum]|uniref:Uncharacterized protein n=1 Tax=Streptosporangium lutulentum TaxID=1461250 RepID=A0ABT9Q8C7_9ACTN|nr:hypothetical protein [Streptosporangium lutulentum]MDP9842984.1 hypothetical protein [Streptosporangium lutulentum]
MSADPAAIVAETVRDSSGWVVLTAGVGRDLFGVMAACRRRAC